MEDLLKTSLTTLFSNLICAVIFGISNEFWSTTFTYNEVTWVKLDFASIMNKKKLNNIFTAYFSLTSKKFGLKTGLIFKDLIIVSPVPILSASL